jgi:hypothetical protein
MWALLIITIINDGGSPAKFETMNYPTLEACMQARTLAERNPAAHGYCSFEPRKSK